jgi:hypothetical protein
MRFVPMFAIILAALCACAGGGTAAFGPSGEGAAARNASATRSSLRSAALKGNFALTITVEDLTTGKPIAQKAHVPPSDSFQVTVTDTADVSCAGQFAVTALGTPSAPPEVLVQYGQYVLGPSGSGSSSSGTPLTGSSNNDWKISATCNGAKKNQFAAASFEFFNT